MPGGLLNKNVDGCIRTFSLFSKAVARYIRMVGLLDKLFGLLVTARALYVATRALLIRNGGLLIRGSGLLISRVRLLIEFIRGVDQAKRAIGHYLMAFNQRLRILVWYAVLNAWKVEVFICA